MYMYKSSRIQPWWWILDDENETFFDLVTVSLINNHFGEDNVTTDIPTMVAPSTDHEILTEHNEVSKLV